VLSVNACFAFGHQQAKAKMSLVVKRSVTLDGHKTSVTLEDEFWDALRAIAYRDKTTVVSLVGQVNTKQEQSILGDTGLCAQAVNNGSGAGEAEDDSFDKRCSMSEPFSR
jgi:hypothetical protein